MASPRANKRTKTAQGRRFTPSFDVFWKYIVISEHSVDVSGIFTRPCFEEWIATRSGKDIVHPEQSYQRVLYAHIRGADHRKPFPERVEREILKQLRAGKEHNPWERLFGGSTLRVGRRGFKSKGYHEALKGKSNPSNTTQTTSGNSVSVSSSTSLNPLNVYWPELLKNFKNISETSRALETPWDLLSWSLNSHHSKDTVDNLLDAAASCGLDLFSSDTYQFFQKGPDPTDLRFSWDFLLPAPAERTFLNDRDTGLLTISPLNIISGEDEKAISILGRSVNHKHFFELSNNIITALYATIKHIPEIMSNGYVWRRDIFRKGTNQTFVCLHKIELVGNEFKLRLQDISDLYPANFLR